MIITIEYVKKQIELWSKYKAKLLSTEYVNLETPLKIQCECGEIFWRTFANIRNRRLVLCKKCTDKLVAEKRRTNLDDIKRQIAEVGCEYISGEYINTHSKLKIRCSCGQEYERKWIHFKEGQIHCWDCGVRLSAESRKYISGFGLLKDTTRARLTTWIQRIKDLYNNQCPITGIKTDNLSVHHLISFNTIYKETLNEFGIQDNNEVCRLEDYMDFIDAVLQKHTLSIGIPIIFDIHKQFHKEYGYGDNTKEQFNNFLLKHYNVTLKQIQCT